MSKKKPPLEKQVQREIVRALHTMGFQVDDLSQPRATMLPRGLPDLRIRHPAWRLRVWVECKRPGVGKLSEHQLAWHAFERECGGKVITVSSVEDLVEQLIELGAPIQREAA